MTAGRKIIEGLRDAVRHAEGDTAAAEVSTIDVPTDVDVRTLRTRLGLSQREFSLRFGFSLGTIRNWEQGRRRPGGSDRVLLTLIAHDPHYVTRVLADERSAA